MLVAVVLLAVAATVLTVRGRTVEGRPQPASRPVPGLPAQLLLASSMRKQPVTGWKVSAADVGLPPGTVMKPIGNLGDRGYFVGITGEGWWLVGIDVSVGRRLFAPVRLGPAGDALRFNCFVNGPTMVLCVRQGDDVDAPAQAWVIDTVAGKLVFDGPTGVRVGPAPGHPQLRQIGDYVVAEVSGSGVHGVGPHGELTWFVGGDGVLSSQFDGPSRDVASPNLGVQRAGTGDVVFSVADGKVVKPQVARTDRLGSAIVYPGGPGYEYTTSAGADRVAFFDGSGKPLGRAPAAGTLLVGSLDLPMVDTGSADVVVTTEGRQLLQVARSVLMPYARLIGTRLLVTTDKSRHTWRQYDLSDGAQGKTCANVDLGSSYIGSDGQVAVVVGRRSPAQAFDLDTCEPLWSLPGSTQTEAKDVWKVNTTLIQRTNDELFSLVAG